MNEKLYKKLNRREVMTNPNCNFSSVEIVEVEKVFLKMTRCKIRYKGKETTWFFSKKEAQGLDGKKEGDGDFSLEVLARNLPQPNAKGASNTPYYKLGNRTRTR